MRADMAELKRSSVDMIIMGQVMAFTKCYQVNQEHCERKRNPTVLYHQGQRVCKTTFLFLHSVGDFCLRAIKAHYLKEGIIPRIHGLVGRPTYNALVLEDVRGIILFVLQYAETNGILLPGRIPGYKRDDLLLLPSSTTKRAV